MLLHSCYMHAAPAAVATSGDVVWCGAPLITGFRIARDVATGVHGCARHAVHHQPADPHGAAVAGCGATGAVGALQELREGPAVSC